MINAMPRLRHAFLSSREGATAIEFAIVAPVLFLLVMGVIELGLIFFTNAVLEGATNIGSRIGKTGYSSGGPREDYIMSRIRELSGGILNTDNLTISILSYNNFDNIGQPEACITAQCRAVDAVPGIDFVDTNGNGSWNSDQGKSAAGGAGAIVLYRVSYVWKLFTPLMSALIGDAQGNVTISSVAAVRNEPF
jgi:Flp pilus assembly protein TadG